MSDENLERFSDSEYDPNGEHGTSPGSPRHSSTYESSSDSDGSENTDVPFTGRRRSARLRKGSHKLPSTALLRTRAREIDDDESDYSDYSEEEQAAHRSRRRHTPAKRRRLLLTLPLAFLPEDVPWKDPQTEPPIPPKSVEYVPSVAFIVIFMSTFKECFEDLGQNYGPQDIEEGVMSTSEPIKKLFLRLLMLVLNRKKEIEPERYGSALSELHAIRFELGMNQYFPDLDWKSKTAFEDLDWAEKLELLHILCHWCLANSIRLRSLLKKLDDAASRPWIGTDNNFCHYYLVRGEITDQATQFRLYKEANRYLYYVPWTPIASTPEQLAKVASELKAEGRASELLAEILYDILPELREQEEKRLRELKLQRRRQDIKHQSELALQGLGMYAGRTRARKPINYAAADYYDEDLRHTRRSTRLARQSRYEFEAEEILGSSRRREKIEDLDAALQQVKDAEEARKKKERQQEIARQEKAKKLEQERKEAEARALEAELQRGQKQKARQEAARQQAQRRAAAKAAAATGPAANPSKTAQGATRAQIETGAGSGASATTAYPGLFRGLPPLPPSVSWPRTVPQEVNSAPGDLLNGKPASKSSQMQSMSSKPGLGPGIPAPHVEGLQPERQNSMLSRMPVAWQEPQPQPQPSRPAYLEVVHPPSSEMQGHMHQFLARPPAAASSLQPSVTGVQLAPQNMQNMPPVMMPQGPPLGVPEGAPPQNVCPSIPQNYLGYMPPRTVPQGAFPDFASGGPGGNVYPRGAPPQLGYGYNQTPPASGENSTR